jgi:hypothetical protein
VQSPYALYLRVVIYSGQDDPAGIVDLESFAQLLPVCKPGSLSLKVNYVPQA